MNTSEVVVSIVTAIVFGICLVVMSAHITDSEKRLDKIEQHVGLDECDCCRDCGTVHCSTVTGGCE